MDSFEEMNEVSGEINYDCLAEQQHTNTHKH